MNISRINALLGLWAASELKIGRKKAKHNGRTKGAFGQVRITSDGRKRGMKS